MYGATFDCMEIRPSPNQEALIRQAVEGGRGFGLSEDAVRTAWPLWLPRLSMTTICHRATVGSLVPRTVKRTRSEHSRRCDELIRDRRQFSLLAFSCCRALALSSPRACKCSTGTLKKTVHL